MRDEYIRAITGQILGVIRTFDNGDQAALNYPGMQILGYYRKKQDVTTDLVGRILSRSNTVISLIYK